MVQLTEGSLEAIVNGTEVENPIMQILACKKISANNGKDRYRLLISDGRHLINFAMLASQLNEHVTRGEIAVNTVVKIKKYITSTLQGKVDKRLVVILDLDVLMTGEEANGKIGDPKPYAAEEGSSTNQESNQTTLSTSSTSVPKQSTMSNFTVAARNSSNSSNDASLTHPIESLSPYHMNWIIKARVMNKSSIRTWSNSRGEGKLFNFDICDESGEIRVTAFKDDADRFFDMIQPDKVYYIQKCQVKPANKQFSTLKHNYELTLGRDTIITECHDVSNVPSVSFNFVPVAKIADLAPNSILDVIGVCKECSDVVSFTSRAQKELKKREVTLVDQSNTSVNLTLWGKDAEEFDGSTQPIVAVKNARITEFQGSKSLSAMMSSMLRIDPDIPEAHKLRGWFDNGGAQLDTTNISGRTGQNVPSSCRLMTFEDIKNERLGHDASPDYYQVLAEIALIRTENCVYMACPSKDCNKKVIDQTTGMYRCEKCKQEFPNFKYRLLLSANLVDVTGGRWVTLFASEAEKILNRTSQEIGEWMESDKKSAIDHISSFNFQRYLFTCRVKMENYNDESRLKTIVVKVSDINYKEINQNLLGKIRNLTGVGKVGSGTSY